MPRKRVPRRVKKAAAKKVAVQVTPDAAPVVRAVEKAMKPALKKAVSKAVEYGESKRAGQRPPKSRTISTRNGKCAVHIGSGGGRYVITSGGKKRYLPANCK